jgi:hypothetical protein
MQAFNGGRAIRGFQMKMNTDHAGLMDRAQQFANQLRAGGQLSDAQIRDMVNAAQLSFQALDGEMKRTVANAQARGRAMGLDDELVQSIQPDGYDPDYASRTQDGGGGGGGGSFPTPPPEAIGMLKKDPASAAHFDVTFGPGAAERILGR